MTRIEGFAVVCRLGCIADASGAMPERLKTDAEWAFFQAGLDRADVVVLGRASHEATPNVRRRRRLVVTTQACKGPLPDDGAARFWTPSDASLEAGCASFGVDAERVAVAGGRDVFGLFLNEAPRFTTFFLSEIADVALEGGRAVFPDMAPGGQREALSRAGYRSVASRRLDDRAIVSAWTPHG